MILIALANRGIHPISGIARYTLISTQVEKNRGFPSLFWGNEYPNNFELLLNHYADHINDGILASLDNGTIHTGVMFYAIDDDGNVVIGVDSLDHPLVKEYIA